ncbi:glycosyltransferase family 4 protein [Pilimelia columellifera]|uniref:glycosyltransferase family 4 protein n=1 Tax=Pilimelia columellifera TaxID=706574 RepID=UPI0031DC77A3
MTGAVSGADIRRGQVVQVLASSAGGIGAHVASVTRGLRADGAPVTVCAPASALSLFDFGDAATSPVEIPPSPRLADLRAVWTLRRAIRTAGHVSVVHAHGLRAGFVAVLARTGRPLVVTWHNAPLSGGVRAVAHRVLETAVARGADVTLGASSDLVERARRVGGRDVRLGELSAPRLAPGRSRAEVRAELGLGEDVPLLLTVGRLHPQKRLDVLVAAAARWRDLRPTPLVAIAGDGPDTDTLQAQVARANAPVRLLGRRSDVADLLAAADLAVVTSSWEARQLFVQEALRAGLPLVATAVGGIPGLVGDAARLIPANDVDAVDSAVRELLGDPQERVRLTAAGRARAATWPSEAQTVAALADLYRQLDRGSGR